MSRLEEALNKAALAEKLDAQARTPIEPAAPVAGADASSLPSAPWQFETTAEEPAIEPIIEPIIEPTAEPAGESPAVRVSTWDLPSALESFQFGEVASGKTIVGPEAESCLVEQYRRLAAALHHAQIQRGVRTVMVTSAVASEGKTLTATNLALTLSQSQPHALFVRDAPWAFLSLGPSQLEPVTIRKGDELMETYTLEIADVA